MMVRVAILRPRSSTATIVCERLCASIPNVIMGMAFPDRETGEVHGPAVVSRRAALRTIAMTAGNKVERTRRNNSTLPLGKRCKWCSLLVECRHGLSEALTRPLREHGNCDQPRAQLSSATSGSHHRIPEPRKSCQLFDVAPCTLTGSPGSTGEDSQRKWSWYEEHHQIHSGVARGVQHARGAHDRGQRGPRHLNSILRRERRVHRRLGAGIEAGPDHFVKSGGDSRRKRQTAHRLRSGQRQRHASLQPRGRRSSGVRLVRG